MQQPDSRSASIVARALAYQAGVAIWLCLFDFLLRHYLAIDDRNLLPGVVGRNGFDIARFVISAIAAGLLMESIVIGRYSASKNNLKVWYICLLFLLPYFHHFLSSNPILECFGLGLMLYACFMSEVRLWMVDDSLVGRLFYIALALPTVFMVTDHFAVNFLPKYWWYWVPLELPFVYLSSLLTATAFTYCSAVDRQMRSALSSLLVVLNAIVWYFAIVKPY